MKSWCVFVFQLHWLQEFIMSQRDFSNNNVIFCGKKTEKTKLPFALNNRGIKFVFSQPGATTGPINYYHCIIKKTSAEEKKIAGKSTIVPLLTFGATEIRFLERFMADAYSGFVMDLAVKHIPSAAIGSNKIN